MPSGRGRRVPGGRRQPEPADPDDPCIAERQAVMDRVEAGQLTIKAAAAQMAMSETWACKLRDDRRDGGVAAARLRKDTLDRLATDDDTSQAAHPAEQLNDLVSHTRTVRRPRQGTFSGLQHPPTAIDSLYLIRKVLGSNPGGVRRKGLDPSQSSD